MLALQTHMLIRYTWRSLWTNSGCRFNNTPFKAGKYGPSLEKYLAPKFGPSHLASCLYSVAKYRATFISSSDMENTTDVLLFGDSLTEGYYRYGTAYHSYGHKLQELFDSNNLNVKVECFLCVLMLSLPVGSRAQACI